MIDQKLELIVQTEIDRRWFEKILNREISKN